jgi:hypothetical protein
VNAGEILLPAVAILHKARGVAICSLRQFRRPLRQMSLLDSLVAISGVSAIIAMGAVGLMLFSDGDGGAPAPVVAGVVVVVVVVVVVSGAFSSLAQAAVIAASAIRESRTPSH